MALLTRKGGGLPANYREVYFWLNHAEVPEGEAAHAAAETRAAQIELAAAAEMHVPPASPEIPEAAAEAVAEAVAPADAEAAAEEAQAEVMPEVGDVAIATVAAKDSESAEAGPENGQAIEAETAEGVPEVAVVKEPAAATLETEAESAPVRKLENLRELPKRGGTMFGLKEDSTTAEDAAQASEAEENARGRGFWGFRRRKRA